MNAHPLRIAWIASADRLRKGSGPYPLVGAFMHYNETFKGAVRVNFSTATSYLTVDTTNSKIHCEELSRVTGSPIARGCCEPAMAIAALQPCNAMTADT
jgi:hypothetical protein